MNIPWKKTKSPLRGAAAALILFLILLLFLWVGASEVSRRSALESTRLLTEAVDRAVVQCYAVEGMYPPNVEYLEDHYGLLVDHDRYIVHYEAFASNLFPTIAVIPLYQ